MPQFTEKQYIRQPFLIGIIALIVIGVWATFVQQIFRGQPVGSNPMNDWGVVLLALVLGIGLPALFIFMHVRTTVLPGSLVVEVVPFSRRKIAPAEIVRFGVRTVRPIRDYGGWGIRGWGGKRAYLMSGDTGVELDLVNGDTILIGSSRPQELAAAIAAMKNSQLASLATDSPIP